MDGKKMNRDVKVRAKGERQLPAVPSEPFSFAQLLFPSSMVLIQ
jgi:hypothetical protein